MDITFTDREADVMQVLWDHGPSVETLTSKLFKGSAELLMTHLVSDQKLSRDQIRRMRELLAEQDEKEHS